MTTDRPGHDAPPAMTDEEAQRDAERINAELIGSDGGTDPFVAAVRATRMPMIITDPRLPDNPLVFCNDAFCRLSGYSRDEILGQNCRFLQGQDTDPDTVRQIREAVRAARAIQIDIQNYRKDGRSFWNRLLLAPVHDAGGTLAYFFASQMDVTLERERLEGLESDKAALIRELAGQLRAQEERERQLRFTLEAAQFGAWSLDLAKGELTTSSVYRANFGRDPGQAFGYAEMVAAIHPEDRTRVLAATADAVTQRRNYDIEYRVVGQTGETRWVEIRGQPISTEQGAAVRLTGVSRDITERKRAERLRLALGDLDEKLRSLNDTADLGYAAGEILGTTLGVSRAGYGTIDIEAETITIERDWNAPGIHTLAGVLQFRDYGSYIEDLKRGATVVFADAERDPRTQETAEALKAISAQAVVNMPVTERSGLVALAYLNHATAREWTTDELEFVREVATRTRSVIERRRAEQDLARLNASLEQQVAERTRELLTAEEALRQAQKMEAVGQLTGGVAHDFNNLLTVIRSSVDLMRRPDLPEERRRRYIDAISETVSRAAKLTGQLLAFARRQALKPETFDVGESLTALGEMMGTLTGSRIEIDLLLDGEHWYTHADPTQFDTAVVNMAVNARDAMKGEGRLTIAVHGEAHLPDLHATTVGPYVAVSITDTGHGIPPEDLGRIFEPFFTTKGVGQGTGLGLSQVFGFAKQSGGEIRVSSTPGQGTTFTLYLPQVSGTVERESRSPDMPMTNGMGVRVLVVEDNEAVGSFARQSLAELGYSPTLVLDASAALQALSETPQGFDVVFSDVVMPGMNGVELAQEIQRLHPGLPVILTSGYSHVLARKGTHGFELLHKPYSIDQLSHALQRMVRQESAASGPTG